MNKSELVASVAEKTNLTKKDTEATINAFMASVEEALKAGEKVQMIGFGTFEIRDRKARTGRNPQKPGEVVEIAASKAPSGNGGAGPTHFDNVMNMRKLDTHVNNTYSERTSLTGGNVLHRAPRASLENIAELREFLRQSPMGYVQAFTTLG